jgi:hypothetical protein
VFINLSWLLFPILIFLNRTKRYQFQQPKSFTASPRAEKSPNPTASPNAPRTGIAAKLKAMRELEEARQKALKEHKEGSSLFALFP